MLINTQENNNVIFIESDEDEDTRPVNEPTQVAAEEILEVLGNRVDSVWSAITGEICVSYYTGEGNLAYLTIIAEDELL